MTARPYRSSRLLPLLGAALLAAVVSSASAQIYVADPLSGVVYDYSFSGQLDFPGSATAPSLEGIALSSSGSTLYAVDDSSTRTSTVAQYNSTTLVQGSNFISNLNRPTAITTSSAFDYVGFSAGGVTEYNASTGASVTSISTGSSSIVGLASLASYVFVATGSNTIGEYTINPTTGALVSSNASFFTGLSGPLTIAASGTDLYVGNSNSVSDYKINPSTGALSSSNTSFISIPGIAGTPAIAVSGSDIFVTNGNSSVAEYSTSGALINAALISGVSDINGLAVQPSAIPEPTDWAFLSGCGTLALMALRRARRILA